VGDVVEVGRCANHLRTSVRVRFYLLVCLTDGEPSTGPVNWTAIPTHHHHRWFHHCQAVLLVDVAEVGDVRHLLEERQVEAARLQQRPGLPDVDGLTPLPGGRVEHVDVRVAVHEQEAVWGGGDAGGGSRVHDLHLT